MGSFRRGLKGGTVLAFASAPAWAQEVCDRANPGWAGEKVTALEELLLQVSSPFALVLLVLTALAIRLRNANLVLVVVVGWTALVSLSAMYDPSGEMALAVAAGCRARPTLFIVMVAAICIGTVLYTNRRSTRL